MPPERHFRERPSEVRVPFGCDAARRPSTTQPRVRFHQALNDSLAGAGNSEPGNGSLRIMPRRDSSRPAVASRCAAWNRRGPDITQDIAAVATASGLTFGFAATAAVRSCVSTDGMSIRTGHTSKQAPHSEEAYGRDAACSSCMSPTSWRARIVPIGPGYTEPYACPPVRSYTGHTFRHAEDRMALAGRSSSQAPS